MFDTERQIKFLEAFPNLPTTSYHLVILIKIYLKLKKCFKKVRIKKQLNVLKTGLFRRHPNTTFEIFLEKLVLDNVADTDAKFVT